MNNLQRMAKGVLVSVLVLLFLVSCGRRGADPESLSVAVPDTSVQVDSADFYETLSDEERALIQAIRDKGGLVTAVTSRASITEGGEDSAISGFNPQLFNSVAALLDIPYTVQAVPFLDILGKDGAIPPQVLTDPNFSYTPTAFQTIDLALTYLTPVPWRLKILRYIPIVPNQNVVVVRKEDSQASLEELKTFEFLLVENTSYVQQYQEFVGTNPQAPPPLYVSTDADVLAALSAGQGRATLVDGVEFFPHFQRYPDLVAVHGVSALHYVGWVTTRENQELAALMSKAVSHLFATGEFHRIFRQYFGMEYHAFGQIIGLTPGQQIHEISFSLDELNAIDTLRKRGKLSAAVFLSEESYRVLDDGRNVGFDYNMVKELAAFLGLEADILLIQDINEFWAKDGVFDPGVIQDTSIRYTPDLFSQVQVFAGSFGVNEWRSRLVDFIPLYPAALAIVGIGADEILQFADMEGKRVVVTQGGFQMQLLRSLEQTHGFTTQVVLVEQGVEEGFDVIADGRADISIDGSLFIARGMQAMEGFTVSPLKLSVVPVAWAVEKGNTGLQSVIGKFIDLSLATQSFHKYWSEGFGVPFDFYLELIN